MKVDYLLVKQFRCIHEQRLELHPKMNLFLGKNGQGKTSWLEALYYWARLVSPRTSVREDLIEFGKKGALISGSYTDQELVCGITADRKKLLKDEIAVKAMEYIELTPKAVWLDHRDLLLVRGGAEVRRKFLDQIGFQWQGQYVTALKGYERAWKTRNFLLKKEEIISWAQIDAYSLVMQQHALVLRDLRSSLVNNLKAKIQSAYQRISGGDEVLEIEYICGFEGDDLMSELYKVRDEEQRVRSTLVGCHRDELSLKLNGVEAGRFASEGQQRSIALALKMGQAIWLEIFFEDAPLILIDDIFGELDEERRRRCFELISKECQIFITTTQFLTAFEELNDYKKWYVRAGKIEDE